MYIEIIKAVEPEFEKALDFAQKKVASFRTGRANPALVEDIKVECFGDMLPIKQVAAISVASARQLMIQPWDRSYIESIERAISREVGGLSPKVEGNSIIINLPPMSEELRKELSRSLSQIENNAKETIRKYRDEAWSDIQAKTREGLIREDDKFKAKDKLQEVVDKYNKKIDEFVSRKRTEIEG
ncbi:MAG: ribosome recycling factor [Minisyncoccus archaeiphilus]|uniref:ribosome-recycling factor n=1 Tax=Minisyncoccus archaeiphilus TaxID=3238481 RepID=UPI0009CC373B|nr:MAG: Ribosome-recycling factor [Parcubacteria group bacterium ADurb.Bin216]GMX59772.1 MAG: ribosome recycling factor [Candidatus Parcubacteria bacterium]